MATSCLSARSDEEFVTTDIKFGRLKTQNFGAQLHCLKYYIALMPLLESGMETQTRAAGQ